MSLNKLKLELPYDQAPVLETHQRDAGLHVHKCPYDQAPVLNTHLRDAGQHAHRCLHSYAYHRTIIHSCQCTESARVSVN